MKKILGILLLVLILSASFVYAGKSVGQFEITGKAVEEAEQKQNNSGSITGKAIEENSEEQASFFTIIKNFFKKVFDFFK